MHARTIIHLRGFPCRLNKVIYIGCLAHSGKLLKQILLLSLSLLFSLFIHSFTHSTRVEPPPRTSTGLVIVGPFSSNSIPHSLLLCAVPQEPDNHGLHHPGFWVVLLVGHGWIQQTSELDMKSTVSP